MGLGLPPVPGDIIACVNQVVPEPKSIRTKEDVVRVIGELKASERAKTKCGRRLIALYDQHRKILSKRR